MANLKNTILLALRNGKITETTFEDLYKSQKNLLENYFNPEFNHKDKNKMLKQYKHLENVGKSLYRYNALNENNLESDVERTDIENTILKAGFNYNFKKLLPEEERTWIMPCNGPIVGRYGEPRSTHVHNGIDIAVPVGTPIKAIADGIVVVAGPTSGYGYWVGINHGVVNGNKVSSEYGHLSKWIVNNGQKVNQGQIIAYSGNTGYSQGPHLHLTIRHGNPGKGGGIAVNPWIYIDNTKY